MRYFRPPFMAPIIALSMMVTACGQPATDQTLSGDSLAAADDPAGWPSIGGSSDEQHYSKMEGINTANVGQLGLAWSLDLDTFRGQEATPFVIGDTIYSTTAWSKVIAVDAVSGKLKWQYDPEVPGPTAYKACCDVVNRGAAYYDGKIYSATLDGRLIALDAETGKLVWSVDTIEAGGEWSYTITGAPRIAKGKIIIGNGGADYGVRGYVTAYDAKSGKQVWRFYTVPGDPAKGPDGAASDDVLKAKAQETWFGDHWKYGGGGTVWDAIVYDEELDQLYLGVGNGSPWNHRIRSDGKGDNLFLSSIVALDPDTGEYIWHYQETPGESWDFTATQPIILADLNIDGADRKVLMQAPKNGFFYVIDRKTGKLVSAKNFVPTSWATSIDMTTGRPVETANARYLTPEVMLPGGPGAHNWQPMAYSQQTGLVYIPAQLIPFLYVGATDFKFEPGRWNPGVDLEAAPPPSTDAEIKAARDSLKGALIAWNPVTQKAEWTVSHKQPVNGGVLATAGGLVFQATAAGDFFAYDAASGKQLWQYDIQNGAVAAPMTYKIGSTQYVALMVGYGGAMALALPSFEKPKAKLPGRLLVFKLDGDGKLAPPTEALALALTDEKLSSEAVERGAKLYATNCSSCHAAGTMSGGVVPDLRRSAIITDAIAWRSVVLEGALTATGMISFKDKITSTEAEDIRAYVQAQARKQAERDQKGK